MNVFRYNKTYFSIFLAILITCGLVYLKHSDSDSVILGSDAHLEHTGKLSSLAANVKVPVLPAPKLTNAIPIEEEFPHKVKRNVPLYTHLMELEVPSIDVIEMVKASKPVRNLSYLMPGTRFQIIKDKEGNLAKATFRFSPVEKLVVTKKDQKWAAEKVLEKVDIKNVSFVGHVESTLWESALEAQMDPYLIFAMAEIFGWEVDFNREVQSGDYWRITAEQKFVKGQPVGWGDVLASEYVNQGKVHTAVLYREGDEEIGYYSLEGENLRKMFLKSPLKFGRITSRFNRRRFHPKLRITRPHNGVDYGAPIGTPVRSVANGVIMSAGYRGGGGKVVKVRHNSTYQTAYKHLSRYGKGIRSGTKVRQGQIIAYTGNTGLSTGPHLHYEFYKHGRFVDPLRQDFPSAEPIAKELKAKFTQQAKVLMATLPNWKPKYFKMEPEKTWAQHLMPDIHDRYFLLRAPSFWASDKSK